MPDTKDFLKAFHLSKGSKWGQYKVTKVQAQHQVIEQYKKYAFPIHVEWDRQEQKATLDDLNKEMHEQFSKEQCVYSRYGNPYRCQIKILKVVSSKDQSILMATLHGTAVRSFTLPKKHVES
jgi:hypothetical protein